MISFSFIVLVTIGYIINASASFVFQTNIYFDGLPASTFSICEGQRPEDAVSDFLYTFNFDVEEDRQHIYDYILNWVCNSLTWQSNRCTTRIPSPVMNFVNIAHLGYPMNVFNIRSGVDIDFSVQCACSHMTCTSDLHQQLLNIANDAITPHPNDTSPSHTSQEDKEDLDMTEDQFRSSDPYVVLGLSRNDDITESMIRQRYRLLAKKYHPDKNLHRTEWATDVFKNITQAYEMLVDPTRRHAYDAQADGTGYTQQQESGMDSSGQTFQFHSSRSSSGGSESFTFTFHFGF